MTNEPGDYFHHFSLFHTVRFAVLYMNYKLKLV